jgi:hypothetical protein
MVDFTQNFNILFYETGDVIYSCSQKTVSYKVTSIAYTPKGKCYAPNCAPPLLAACKVVLSGMKILKNYACCQDCLLHGTNAS